MSKFKMGDRVVVNQNGHLFRGIPWRGIEECRPGDTGTVVNEQNLGGDIRVRLDNPRRTSASNTVISPQALELIVPDQTNGEGYLDRAIDWLSDNADDTLDMSVQDALAIAQFLFNVEQNK